MKTIGQIAYEAHVGDFHPITQEGFDWWDDLLPHVRSHWEIIAQAIADKINEAICPNCGAEGTRVHECDTCYSVSE